MEFMLSLSLRLAPRSLTMSWRIPCFLAKAKQRSCRAHALRTSTRHLGFCVQGGARAANVDWPHNFFKSCAQRLCNASAVQVTWTKRCLHRSSGRRWRARSCPAFSGRLSSLMAPAR